MFKKLLMYVKGVAALAYLPTVGLLKQKNRELLGRVGDQVFGGNGDKPVKAKVPVVELSDFIFSFEVKGDLISLEDGNVTDLELKAIAKLVQLSQAKTIFEIGTFNGRTTLAMAQNAPAGAHVYTLDLPAEELDSAKLKLAEGDAKYVQKEKSGSFFEGKKERSMITQLYGDSANFDFSPYYGKIDLMFVDGAHSYEYLLSDTKVAMQLMNPAGGVILWHDFDTQHWEGVTRGLNELHASGGKFAKLVNLKPTSLVCLIQGNIPVQ